MDFFYQLAEEFNLPLTNPVLIFSLILFIILLAPILLRRLNVPGIIGLIISGVIIGPYGLHLLENNSAIKLFSTIGLLYIMFIAGLELDLNEFKTHKNKSLIFGFFTFVIPIILGYPLIHYVFGYDFNASLLTASMFATHTLVAYPIVSKFGVAKDQAVAITVGGTILTDTAVLIILAVILGNSQGSLDESFWIRLGISFVIFSAIMFLLVPRVAKWFFKKLESDKHSHYIFVLAVVFFGAFLAEVAGLESIIGAFVAGLALNPLIPNSSALMNRIEYIGNSLFIPFFLISVGMLVDIRVIMSGPMAIILALALSAMAIFGKWIAAWFTQIIFKYTGTERQLIFGLSSAHAAATLAVILVGHQAGIIDDNILNGTIILILITSLVASFAAEKAAKKLALTMESDLTDEELKNESIKDEQILIPVANLEKLEGLLDFALIIKDKKSDNPISLLSVVANDQDANLNIFKQKKEMEKFIEQGSATETKIDTITAIDHNPASGISRTSKEIMADYVIMTWPQKSTFLDRIFGERIDSIIRKVDKNLMICRFSKPLIENKRLLFICPPHIEKEEGFPEILQKVFRMAQEYTIPVFLYGEKSTEEEVNRLKKLLKITGKHSFTEFTYWEDFLIITKDINPNDFIMFAAGRAGSIAYHSHLDKIPAKLEHYMKENNLIVVYPRDEEVNGPLDEYEEFTATPIHKGIDVLGNIGKGLGSWFKRDKDEEE